MYRVLCDNALMCDSRIEELALTDPVIQLEENKAGSFSFIVPPDHPFYNMIQRRKTIVEVYMDDEEEPIFSGMSIEATDDFYKRNEIYCEGELSFLNDSIQRPARYQGYTVRGLLEAYIENHNVQVEESKHFQVGIVTVHDPNDYIYCYTNMETTMTCLKNDLVDDLGGIIRIRHEEGIRYIDYLAESPNTNSQVIRLGDNLLDFARNIDSSEIATAIIPLGAKLAESTVEGLETRLDIKSVNDGLDYVYSPEAVEAYGWIHKKVEFDDVTNASTLKTKGEQYLAETQFENMVIEAKAIDLNLTDKSIERFKISDQIRVVSAPHALNKYFRLTKRTLNLNNPKSDTVTLGKNEAVTLSAKTAAANEEIKKAISKIVPATTILQDAVANSTALIASAMGGYVVKTRDELLVMDTDNIETATKVWRWNINGLAYSSTGYDGEYALAMTMDGTIVADRIATGTMHADRIRGGTLKLGGAQNVNGEMEILSSDGGTLGKWSSEGFWTKSVDYSKPETTYAQAAYATCGSYKRRVEIKIIGAVGADSSDVFRDGSYFTSSGETYFELYDPDGYMEDGCPYWVLSGKIMFGHVNMTHNTTDAGYIKRIVCTYKTKNRTITLHDEDFSDSAPTSGVIFDLKNNIFETSTWKIENDTIYKNQKLKGQAVLVGSSMETGGTMKATEEELLEYSQLMLVSEKNSDGSITSVTTFPSSLLPQTASAGWIMSDDANYAAIKMVDGESEDDTRSVYLKTSSTSYTAKLYGIV